MDSRFRVQLDDLPKYGLRTRSRYAEVIHRFADDCPIPACAGEGWVTSEDPADYKRESLSVVASTRGYSLCSKGECFGRLHLADATTTDTASSTDASRQRRVRTTSDARN